MLILFAPVITTSIHCYVNNLHDIQILMNVIKTETFNVGFTSKYIYLIWTIVFLKHIYIYIYIYINLVYIYIYEIFLLKA